MNCNVKSQKDVENAYKKGYTEGVAYCAEIMLSNFLLYLADRRGWQHDSLKRIEGYLENHLQQVVDGEIKLSDLKETLKTEFDIEVNIR